MCHAPTVPARGGGRSGAPPARPDARVAWRATSPTTSRRRPRRIELHLDLVDEVERGLDGPAHQLSQNRPPWRRPADDRAHHRRRFSGRDPDESNRASTPLELLYDLTIVVAFGTAADELAHYVAEDHVGTGVLGFAFATFAVTWAWLNYSWFASAYDTDDWVFRLATMVQMVGVIVLSLGLQPMFESIDRGGTLDNRVMVAGYVIMRVALVFLWWQVSRHDPERAPAARSYIATIGVAQVGWVVARHPRAPDRRELRCLRRADRLRARAARSSPSARRPRRGTPTTSPSATACW